MEEEPILRPFRVRYYAERKEGEFVNAQGKAEGPINKDNNFWYTLRKLDKNQDGTIVFDEATEEVVNEVCDKFEKQLEIFGVVIALLLGSIGDIPFTSVMADTFHAGLFLLLLGTVISSVFADSYFRQTHEYERVAFMEMYEASFISNKALAFGAFYTIAVLWVVDCVLVISMGVEEIDWGFEPWEQSAITLSLVCLFIAFIAVSDAQAGKIRRKAIAFMSPKVNGREYTEKDVMQDKTTFVRENKNHSLSKFLHLVNAKKRKEEENEEKTRGEVLELMDQLHEKMKELVHLPLKEGKKMEAWS
uniref:Uncharacterized protein n=1 Tax=Chromera velia CCMP2878 TaxID=1169474 RepID=A0A0G4GGQ8_9ALVE|eukprot:Cvel_4663.t1-p1 / transcript=Cvel_4663.t1 / gene=Cvel_4663 / organism=Chromera_velia_CCMP2878 / gene_product=hypothetical protein / transcript_product=hypothetical protein / location=Cvel_scaffold206:15654-16562(-) / protein_length=303 / sequence_SO=supercontig / SO=protein_coding / is_pseudo=false